MTLKMHRVEPCKDCEGTNIGFIAVTNFCYAECKDCQAYGPIAEDKSSAIKLWNLKQRREEKREIYVN
jgi:hypothetical protein